MGVRLLETEGASTTCWRSLCSSHARAVGLNEGKRRGHRYGGLARGPMDFDDENHGCKRCVCVVSVLPLCVWGFPLIRFLAEGGWEKDLPSMILQLVLPNKHTN